MGYATAQQVNRILANSLTTGTSPTADGEPTPLIQFGTTPKTNLVPNDLVYQFIAWADEEINSALSEMYAVPFSEKTDVELELLSDINEYNDTIELDRAAILNAGDVLVFIDGSHEERHIVDSVEGETSITIQDTLVGFYSAATTRVLRVKYPEPITLVSARKAAANIYEKYFAGSVAPNESEFGKIQRRIASGTLNDILNGRIILHGQRRIGRRFYNANLDDRYALPPAENDNSRDLSGSGNQ